MSSLHPIRWWPALAVVILAALRWVQIWFLRESDRQFKVRGTFQMLGVAAALLLIWLLFFSRLRARTKLLVLGTLAAAVGASALLVKVRGFTGDLIPILEWRWQSPAVVPSRKVVPVDDPAQAVRSGADFAQLLGPQRNGVLAEPALAPVWDKHPPQLLWRQPIGAGWAGFAVQGRLAVTLEQAAEREEIVCYDLLTGARRWAHGYPARFEESSAGIGPRSVPTISGERVYATGATGILTCLELATGREVWRCDLLKEHGAQVPNWGFSGSPLVTDGKVVVTPGGPNGHSVAAYEAATGKLLWHAGDDRAGYSSPVLETLAGQPQILVFSGSMVAGFDPPTGRQLWQRAIPTAAHVANPVPVSPTRVLVSCGYGIGTYLLDVERTETPPWTVNQVWKTPRLKSKFANFFRIEDSVYGLDDGRLVCLDLATGDLRWRGERYGHGQLLLVAGRLLVLAENGEVILVEITPKEAREVSRFAALTGKTWNPPALAGEYLLVRNDQEAACYRLPVAAPPPSR